MKMEVRELEEQEIESGRIEDRSYLLAVYKQDNSINQKIEVIKALTLLDIAESLSVIAKKGIIQR
jgi:hypothetical protein